MLGHKYWAVLASLGNFSGSGVLGGPLTFEVGKVGGKKGLSLGEP